MSRPVKRSFTIGGHRTSISLEAAFWEALREIAKEQRVPVAQLVQSIDRDRGASGLSGAVRVWLLAHYQAAAGRARPVAATGPASPPASKP